MANLTRAVELGDMCGAIIVSHISANRISILEFTTLFNLDRIVSLA